MKKTYCNPELLVMICNQDVITSSGTGVVFDFRTGNVLGGERSSSSIG